MKGKLLKFSLELDDGTWLEYDLRTGDMVVDGTFADLTLDLKTWVRAKCEAMQKILSS